MIIDCSKSQIRGTDCPVVILLSVMSVTALFPLQSHPTASATGLGAWCRPAQPQHRTRSLTTQGWIWQWVIAWERHNQWQEGSVIRLLSWDLFFIRSVGEHISLPCCWAGRMCVWNILHPFLLPFGKNLSAVGEKKKNTKREAETSGKLDLYDFQIPRFTHSWGQIYPRPFLLYESQKCHFTKVILMAISDIWN